MECYCCVRRSKHRLAPFFWLGGSMRRTTDNMHVNFACSEKVDGATHNFAGRNAQTKMETEQFIDAFTSGTHRSRATYPFLGWLKDQPNAPAQAWRHIDNEPCQPESYADVPIVSASVHGAD